MFATHNFPISIYTRKGNANHVVVYTKQTMAETERHHRSPHLAAITKTSVCPRCDVGTDIAVQRGCCVPEAVLLRYICFTKSCQ